MPATGAKAKWAEMWCNPQHGASFIECLVAFAVVEGIFFLVPSVPSSGLSNVVCSLAYVL
jgi:hypothetical protein